ncbi:MAG: bacillithiol biosynthesis cysteine-adding enzyme BshC [Saprospiraceae bacterium]|nr:bacillithiol biosynthesis cysteine-adding enzyme BshC [Saprospiraceae bacterium]
MNCLKVPFNQIIQFSAFDHLYADKPELFSELIPHFPRIEAIRNVIEERIAAGFNRERIYELFKEQYEKLGLTGRNSLIESLKERNTYAIVTAHQPLLFGGPLYFLTKIVSVIKLAEQAKSAFPEYNFLPVYYIGGEDHDLEECNHTTVFGKKIIWETVQSGPVGRMTTDDMQDVVSQLCEILGNGANAEELKRIIREAYQPGRTVNEAVIYFVNHLFADLPLLILDADQKSAKRGFIDVIKKEIFDSVAQRLVLKQQEKMDGIGLKPQAFVRPINFFYFSQEGRNRIERKTEEFEVVNTGIRFNMRQMEDEIECYPERFSPNVIMRPLYQDYLLPTVAYVGGGGELAYWSDRKLLFEYFGIPMPVLVRRDSFMIADQSSLKKLDKIKIRIEDLLKEENVLKSEFLARQAEVPLSFGEESKALAQLIEQIQAKVSQIDPSLHGYVGSETSSFFKSLNHIETRVRKSLTGKHEVELQQLHSLYEKFFPGNSLQERQESFLSFCVMYGREFIAKLKECADPLDFMFKIVLPE